MYSIEPFVGPLPLRFGMTPGEVAALIGDADHVFTDPVDGISESRAGLSLGYDAQHGLLSDAVFSAGGLSFHEVNLFEVDDVINFLRGYDNFPEVAVGMVFFLGLGLRLSGFHDGDVRQKAIGVCAAGRWDEFTDDFVPYSE